MFWVLVVAVFSCTGLAYIVEVAILVGMMIETIILVKTTRIEVAPS